MKARFRQGLIASLALLGIAGSAFAQNYPNRPVKVIVGYVPGGGPDFVARALSQKLSQIMGQPFVVENKAGASGTVATAQVAKAPADGYTLLLGETGQLVIAPYVFKNLQYDTVKDFTPVALVGTGPLILVANAKTPIKNVQDLVREAKANPGKLNYGTSGIGSIHNIAMEVFKADAGVGITHVPYKGSGQSVSAVLAGDVPVLITSLTAAAPHIKAGTLNLVAVTSGARMPGYPDVPSLSEVVKDYDFSSEMGVLAPAGLPPEILAQLSKAIKQAVESPDLLEQFKKTSTIIHYTTPEEYSENIRRNLKKYERAVKIAKIPVSE
jgi:tripartite-type tricarboxylate transporter receptor subunit TctC